MEEVFAALGLARNPNAPDNRSWIRLFRMWARADAFRRMFSEIRSTLTADFVAFYEAYIDRPPGSKLDELVPHPWDVQPHQLPTWVPRVYHDPGRREAGV
jgi:hypothetical protein